jgi:hypothetical protein
MLAHRPPMLASSPRLSVIQPVRAVLRAMALAQLAKGVSAPRIAEFISLRDELDEGYQGTCGRWRPAPPREIKPSGQSGHAPAPPPHEQQHRRCRERRQDGLQHCVGHLLPSSFPV